MHLAIEVFSFGDTDTFAAHPTDGRSRSEETN